MPSSSEVVIIGAGVSGLVCALELESAGYAPLVLERSNRVGGRLKTDLVDGLPLDHGFQVLLTAYPAARKYLDLEALDLQFFLPGARIYRAGKAFTIGDPLRKPGMLIDTLFAPAGSVADKLRILRLSNQLKGKSLETIFSAPARSTLSYLRDLGFSDRMIDNFFRPFFAGIFLEPELATSSRMFEFVYKMFSTGYATLPRKGIQAIPEQLSARLQRTAFRFGAEVERLESGEVHLRDGARIEADTIIVATDPTRLLDGASEPVRWNTCTNLYFRSPEPGFGKPIIGLLADPDTLVNNLHFVTDLITGTGESVLSVTVVRAHGLGEKELVGRVKKELQQHCGLQGLELMARYDLPQALPRIQDLKYAPEPGQSGLGERMFVTGDFLANPSLNAAMESGRVAAAAVLGSVKA